MEASIKRAISKALGVTELQGVVIGANLQFRDKINILKTALNLGVLIRDTDIQHFTKVLNKIADYAPTRNMIAHDAFGPSADEQGVEFFVIKAKGELRMPTEVWTIADFDEADDLLEDYAVEMQALMDKIATDSRLKALIDGNPNWFFPAPGQEPQRLLSLHTLGLLGSSHAPTMTQTVSESSKADPV
jgi:hypothetical protein